MEVLLGKCTKNILLLLAEEFETSVSTTDKQKSIIQDIIEASDYNESFAKANLECILKEEVVEQKEWEKQLGLDRQQMEK